MLERIRNMVESNVFGVCTYWGQKFGIETSRIRIFFIYISFLTLGSPLLVYLLMAGFLESKKWFNSFKRRNIWHL
ncbi:MAG: PspC family transcriptional regulator [Flavobacteriales bacterium]